ncbi:hypothetical protein BB559_003565 [Furculomyces boomerangus]|uniref:Cysteine protease n=1 Tax=Furculomyces boomerangus TaxID=61424 RepID=A0A2T9YKJ3_9FUNG|nr:hypothetical protein BB559_003565 [Furculomyces boomerangus]
MSNTGTNLTKSSSSISSQRTTNSSSSKKIDSSLRTTTNEQSDGEPKTTFNNIAADMVYLKYRVVNSIREYYNTTTENVSALLEGRYKNPASEDVWLLGKVYSRGNIKKDSFNHDKNEKTDDPTKKPGVSGNDLSDSELYKQDLNQRKSISASIRDLNLSTFKNKNSLEAEIISQKTSSLYPIDFVDTFQSLIWCTYRLNCRPKNSNDFTSDAGWGCMLRAGQSLVAQALQTHYFGKDIRFKWEDEEKRNQFLKIITLFMDDTSESSIFSIYKMANAGKKQGKTPGEWFGPFGTANILRDLSKSAVIPIKIYSISDGTIRIPDFVEGLGTSVKRDDLQNELLTNCTMEPTLILIATRLGIDRVNPVYNNFIKCCLSMPHSVGIAGGRPSSALYFVGYDGDSLIYLDPHFNRPAIPSKPIGEYSEEDISSYRCKSPKRTGIQRIDPCMFIGFYIHDIEDLVDFIKRINGLEEQKVPMNIVISTQGLSSSQNYSYEAEDGDDKGSVDAFGVDTFSSDEFDEQGEWVK